MTLRALIPLDDEYVKINDETFPLLRDGKKIPDRNRKITTAADILVDTLMEEIMMDFVDSVNLKPFARKVIMTMKGIIEKSSHTLVNKVIKKFSDKQLFALVQFLHDMEVERDGKRYLSFIMEQEAEDTLNKAYEHLDNGDVDKTRKEILVSVQILMEQSLDLFIGEPMRIIEMNFVARKVVELVYSTIQKAMGPALKKVVGSMELDELHSLRDFISTLIVEE